MPVRIDNDSKYFWEGCSQRELRIGHCTECGTWVHFPRGICHNCWADVSAHDAVPGTGRLVSWSSPRMPAVEDLWITGLVGLDPAPDDIRILARIIDCPVEELHIGMAVTVDWFDEDGQVVPQFRRAEESGT